MTTEDVQKLVLRLRMMTSRNPDGRGVYLGDGMPYHPRVDIRSQDLADLLEELLELRKSRGVGRD